MNGTATVDRAELLSALKVLSLATSKRSTIPILCHALLSVENNRLTLTTTDIDVSVQTWVDAESDGVGSCCTPIYDLLKLVGSLEDGPVKLSVVGGDNHPSITVESAASKTRMISADHSKFPSLPSPGDCGVYDVATAALKKMIQATSYAISNDESRFQLNGAMLSFAGETLSMAATDGHRLTAADVDIETASDGFEFIVPRRALEVITALKDGAVSTIRLTDTHLYLHCGRFSVSARRMSGVFPDYRRILNGKPPTRLRVDSTLLLRAVRRVRQMTDGRFYGILMRIDGNSLTLLATDIDRGESEEPVPCTMPQETYETIGFNPAYLLQTLTALKTAEVEVSFKDGQNIAMFTPVEQGDVRLQTALMPMRVEMPRSRW